MTIEFSSLHSEPVLLTLLLGASILGCSAASESTGASGAAADTAAETAARAPVKQPGAGKAGLSGNYGYLTDFTCQDEAVARKTIDTMVHTFGISDVQFYDWFVDYSTPTAGDRWTDPWFHQRQTCLQTIKWYIDELHKDGARAWAYVQSIASEDSALASADAGIYPLIQANGTWYKMQSDGDDHPTYLANAAWGVHQVGVWGKAVAGLGFDGLHWDTLGPKAASYADETAGFHAFLATTRPLLAKMGLLQTMNFVNVSWWDDSLLDVVEFPYAEVWQPEIEDQLYTAMEAPAMQARSGVMAFYPQIEEPAGWTESQTMIARWNEAPLHHLHYLVVGNGARHLDTEYFPADTALTADDITALTTPAAN